jgi:hypothetical protein
MTRNPDPWHPVANPDDRWYFGIPCTLARTLVMSRKIVTTALALASVLLLLLVSFPKPEAEAQQRRTVRVPGVGNFSVNVGRPARRSTRRGGSATQKGTTQEEPADDDMSQVQAALDLFGFDPGPATGKMGARTRSAISRLQ